MRDVIEFRQVLTLTSINGPEGKEEGFPIDQVHSSRELLEKD
jgi:hypothetical protein